MSTPRERPRHNCRFRSTIDPVGSSSASPWNSADFLSADPGEFRSSHPEDMRRRTFGPLDRQAEWPPCTGWPSGYSAAPDGPRAPTRTGSGRRRTGGGARPRVPPPCPERSTGRDRGRTRGGARNSREVKHQVQKLTEHLAACPRERTKSPARSHLPELTEHWAACPRVRRKIADCYRSPGN